MKKYLLLAILTTLSIAPDSITAQFSREALIAQVDTTISPKIRADMLGKSASKAFLIGLVPGFFVHGLGHFYAGNQNTGSLLLVSEGLSLILILSAGSSSMNSSSMFSDEYSNTDNNDFLAYAGLAIFLGGWVADFAGAPYYVNKHKAAIRKAQRISLGAKNGAIVVNYSFNLG